MRTPRRSVWLLLFLAVGLALPGLPPVAAAAPASTPAAPTAQRESTHFRVRYDPARLDARAVAAAVRAAEEGYARNARVFPVGRLPRQVTLDLTPSFLGATGLARPEQYAIAIRVPDLEYLGLDLDYVMTHEIAHLFTHAELMARGAPRQVVTGPWGEGVADFATGGFGSIPLADWWGQALRAGRLWSRPDWLVDGSARPAEADFVRQRTGTYAQAALVVRYLAQRAGAETFFRFYAEYASAVARPRSGQPARRPDRAALDALFVRHFDASGSELIAAWEQRLAAAQMPREAGARLALHEWIYGSLREGETQYARAVRQGRADEEAASAVREAFRQANLSLRGNDLSSAAAHLARARSLAAPHHQSDPMATAAYHRGGFP